MGRVLVRRETSLLVLRILSSCLPILAPSAISPTSAHTSLEAVYGSRNLHSPCEKIWQAGERQGEEDSERRRGREEDGFGLVAVDLCEGIHVAT